MEFLLALLTFFSIFLGFCYIEYSKGVAAEAPSIPRSLRINASN